MASKATVRTFQILTRRVRPSPQCVNSTSSKFCSIRQLSSSSSKQDVEYETDKEQRPRWSYTPPAMKRSFPIGKMKNPEKDWLCNEDPSVLDAFYVKFLGHGGESILTDEVKWLAITHKSYDQGRRGFNDRLAFLGRRILNLQTTLALLESPIVNKTQSLPSPGDERIPFSHPALERLANLRDMPLATALHKKRLAQLTTQLGMREILRWKPRQPSNMESSGIEVVLTSTLYAIIGAISLQRGTDMANRVVRERILKPLGIS